MKTPSDIRSLARAHTATAVKTLAGIMQQPDAPAAARVQAATALLNRGWGMPQQDIGITPSDAFIQALKQINAIHAEEPDPPQVTH
jgi:hypothetical protein